MENIEELKQANEKLTERLNNAAKFFREQKAQIESLTKENEQLKNDNIVKDDSIRLNNELLETVENLKKENEELEKKFKEQQDFEATNINKVIPELEEKIRSLETQEEAYKKEIVNLQGQLIKSNEDLQKKVKQMKTIDLEQKKIIEARDEWAKRFEETNKKFVDLLEEKNKLVKKIQDYDIAKGEVELKLECIQKEYTKKFEEQENKIKSLNKKYDDLENEKLAYATDYEKLENKFKKLNDDYIILENEKDAYSNSDDALKEIIDILNKHGFEASDEIKPKKETKQTSNPMNGGMMRMA